MASALVPASVPCLAGQCESTPVGFMVLLWLNDYNIVVQLQLYFWYGYIYYDVVRNTGPLPFGGFKGLVRGR